MKSLVKRVLILGGLFCVTLFLMYKSELKSIFIKDKIYIVFDVQKDSYLPVDWGEYASLFPENFNPMLIRENSSELSKLNDKQRFKFDSINHVLFKYPRKTIQTKDGFREYSIGVANGLALGFTVLDSSKIELRKIQDLNVISVDSLLQLIPELYYALPQRKSKGGDRKFYIIVQDQSKAMKLKVVPFVRELD